MEMVSIQEFEKLAKQHNFKPETLKTIVLSEIDNIGKQHIIAANGLVRVIVLNFTDHEYSSVLVTAVADPAADKRPNKAIYFNELALKFLH